MKKIIIEKSTMDFLKAIAKNNNRDWFTDNKETYLKANENMIDFADALLLKMKTHDNIENESGKKSLFRIYKDIRFSKDKTPYKSHFAGHFTRATKQLRGGYYFHIEPGNKSGMAGGFWNPNPEDLKRIRQDIDRNYKDWKKLLANKTLKNTFGEMDGEKVNSAPKGYAKDNPAIDLLRYKQYLFWAPFTDKEVMSDDFVTKANAALKALRPFFDYMSEVLTTDLNGELL
jgi:uncharacterized protein (TIGR02453 family)